MSVNREKKRQQVKISTFPGEIPTIPTGSDVSNWYLDDHTTNNWTKTDIYVGEFFLNANDGRLFTRKINEIIEFNAGVNNLTELNDVLIVNPLSGQTLTYENGIWINKDNINSWGLMNYIPSGTTINVEENFQYLIYDDLTIAGEFENSGEVVIINGSLVLESGGTFTNVGGGVLRLVSLGQIQKEVIYFNSLSGVPLTLSHTLNSTDFIYQSYIDNEPFEPEFEIIDSSNIKITTLTDVSGRIVLIG